MNTNDFSALILDNPVNQNLAQQQVINDSLTEILTQVSSQTYIDEQLLIQLSNNPLLSAQKKSIEDNIDEAQALGEEISSLNAIKEELLSNNQADEKNVKENKELIAELRLQINSLNQPECSSVEQLDFNSINLKMIFVTSMYYNQSCLHAAAHWRLGLIHENKLDDVTAYFHFYQAWKSNPQRYEAALQKIENILQKFGIFRSTSAYELKLIGQSILLEDFFRAFIYITQCVDRSIAQKIKEPWVLESIKILFSMLIHFHNWTLFDNLYQHAVSYNSKARSNQLHSFLRHSIKKTTSHMQQHETPEHVFFQMEHIKKLHITKSGLIEIDELLSDENNQPVTFDPADLTPLGKILNHYRRMEQFAKEDSLTQAEVELNLILNFTEDVPFIKAVALLYFGDLVFEKQDYMSSRTYYERALEIIPNLFEAQNQIRCTSSLYMNSLFNPKSCAVVTSEIRNNVYANSK